MKAITTIRERARALRLEIKALSLAARDPRTPLTARILSLAVLAYALSPIDLIPDFIPIIGYLDDLIVIPAGLALAVRLVPPQVMRDCRAQAALLAEPPASLAGALTVIAIWLLLAALILRLLL